MSVKKLPLGREHARAGRKNLAKARVSRAANQRAASRSKRRGR